MTPRLYELVVCRDERSQLTLDEVARHAGMHPGFVEGLVEFGLMRPDESGFFSPSDVTRLRSIARLRESLGINLAGIAVILDLLEKLHAVQRENERLRNGS